MTALAAPPKAAAAPAADELRRIPLAQLVESPWNPRKHFDPARLAEMAESLKKGQLAPIIVRPYKAPPGFGKHQVDPKPLYEIGAGHRRFRSAPAAGLDSLLAIVRDLGDVAFLELLTIENKQRDDVTPLDEAAGFKLLMEKAGYDVAKLAARIGLSVKYVYDRLKLLQLIPEAKKYLEDGVITAGHAIQLARLKPADQKRVMGDPKRTNRYDAESGGGLFQGEYADHDPDQPGLELEAPVKARSVRELATYINDHVRFRPEETDPFLFPAAAAALKEAETDDLDPVYITYDRMLKFDAKDHKVRTYGISSWRRADGKKKSKTCAWSRVGIVAAGPERGDAFRVCVNRDKCEVHFATSARAKARRTKARAGQPGAGAKPDARAEQEARRAAQDLRERAEKERWKKASRHLVRALSEKLKGLAITVDGTLWRAALRECTPHRHMAGLVPGRSLGSLVRYCVFQHLAAELTGYTWDPQGEWPRLLTPFGIDAKKIVDAAVPKPVPEKKQPATAAAKKKKGKK